MMWFFQGADGKQFAAYTVEVTRRDAFGGLRWQVSGGWFVVSVRANGSASCRVGNAALL